MRVSSSTSNVTGPRSRAVFLLVPLGSIVYALVLSLMVSSFLPADATNLKDARNKVRQQMVVAKKQVSQKKSALAKAEGQLQAAQRSLAAAQGSLNQTQQKLVVAKATDTALLVQLNQASVAATAAVQAETKAEEDLLGQRSVVVSAVRKAYQERTQLQAWTVMLGAQTSADLSDRLYWNEAVFDTTAREYQRLKDLETKASDARRMRVAAQEALADKREASQANVAKIQQLTNAAAAARAKVATLVAQNARLRAVAANELALSQRQYDQLEAAERRIAAQIAGDGSNYANPGGFIRPVNAPSGSPFGMRYHPILHYWRMHWGTDFGAGCGTPIRAMANGRVVSAGWTTVGFGNYTIISYGRIRGANISSGYAHQSKVVVHAGQRVKQGQIVGYVGSTGLSTGCHLHLQIYRNGTRVNPMRYL